MWQEIIMLKALFSVLLLNTGLHAAAAMKFFCEAVHDG